MGRGGVGSPPGSGDHQRDAERCGEQVARSRRASPGWQRHGDSKASKVASGGAFLRVQTARDLFDTATKRVDFNVGKAADVLKELPDAGVIINKPLRDVANVLGSQKYRVPDLYHGGAAGVFKITGSMLPGGVGEVPEGAQAQDGPDLVECRLSANSSRG